MCRCFCLVTKGSSQLHTIEMTPPAGVADPAKRRHFRYNAFLLLLFTRCATSNASRHFKSPLAIGRDAFKSKHASSVSISEVIDTGVNSNAFFTFIRVFLSPEMDSDSFSIFHEYMRSPFHSLQSGFLDPVRN